MAVIIRDQSLTSGKVMLLITSLSGIIKNSTNICIGTHDPDKYPKAQGMNTTKVWLQGIALDNTQGRENNQGYIRPRSFS